MKHINFLILLLLAMNCYANSDLYVSFPSGQVEQSTNLGEVEVEGVGTVKLIAKKNGHQLVVDAWNSDGKVIGRAESVVGLSETPIHISTSAGLKKITIYWGAE